MPPSTRLRRQPLRRVDYSPSIGRQQGSRGNPIRLDSAPPATAEAPAAVLTMATTRTRNPLRNLPRKASAGAKAKVVVKPKPLSEKVVKVPPQKKPPPPKRECSICISSKSISHSYRLVKESDEDVCEHFKNICSQCIKRLATDKVATRQLAEPGLPCIYPECNHVLGYEMLKLAFIRKEAFADYDAALTQTHLTASPNFIACLSTECGLYFSTEDCDTSKDAKAKQLITCPYCDSELCLKCNRPWHANTDCNKAKEAEDAASVKQIQAMGAKPCPKCGVNIEKQGGCDHMTCRKCHHNFCWQCLVPFTPNAQHLDTCPNRRPNVALNPGNWVPEHATVEQINRMFDQARRQMDNMVGMFGPPGAQPDPVLAPGITGQNNVAPAAPGLFNFGNIFPQVFGAANGFFGGGNAGGA